VIIFFLEKLFKFFKYQIMSQDQSASTPKSFLIRDLLKDLIVKKSNSNDNDDERLSDSGNIYVNLCVTITCPRET
jgi:hypothetical protein